MNQFSKNVVADMRIKDMSSNSLNHLNEQKSNAAYNSSDQILSDQLSYTSIKRMKACLLLSLLREKLKIQRSFWLHAFTSEAKFLRLASFWPDQKQLNILASQTSFSASQINAQKIFSEEDLRLKVQSVLADTDHVSYLNNQLMLAMKKEISSICWLSPEYPARLKEISSFPLILYTRGEMKLSEISQFCCLTIVGTRRPTVYGRQATRYMTTYWARQGMLCISGLARGIDGVAHESALAAGAKTIAVLANGLDIIYPPEHDKLAELIMKQGLLLSEHPPGHKPLRQHFPARNRILSGLSHCVVVIEAAEKSGSLITTEFAADQGRDVFAMPGQIFSSESRGCHRLIRDGAQLLMAPDDIFEHLSLTELEIRCQIDKSRQNQHHLGMEKKANDSDPSNQPDKQLRSGKNRSDLSDDTEDNDVRIILQKLHGSSLTINNICEETGLSLGKCSVLLAKLEYKGLIFYERGHYVLTD